MNNYILALNILFFVIRFSHYSPKFLHSPSLFLSVWEGSAFFSFPKKRHEFMNPRSVTMVIDFFRMEEAPRR
jgi:hypothetical protein